MAERWWVESRDCRPEQNERAIGTRTLEGIVRGARRVYDMEHLKELLIQIMSRSRTGHSFRVCDGYVGQKAKS